MSEYNPVPPSPDRIGDMIYKAIQIRTEEIIQQEQKSLSERVEKAIRSEVGLIAARVLTKFSMHHHGSELVIRVDFNNTKT